MEEKETKTETMSLHRYAAKRDANEREIIKALRQLGAEVYELSSRSIPDLLVGWRGVNYLIEVKSDKGKLTPYQNEFHQTWTGQVAIIRSVDEAVTFLLEKR